MIEIIVALAILSTSILAVFGVLRTCSTAAHHTRMLTKAVLFSENLLVDAKLNQKPVFETKNGSNDLFRWQVQIVPTPEENLGAICVNVKWLEQQREQEYELISLIQMEPSFKGK